jgi:hypothetical protein
MDSFVADLSQDGRRDGGVLLRGAPAGPHEARPWHYALTFLSRFLQLDDDRLLSVEAQVLYGFLSAHRNLADILAGSEEGRVLGASMCKDLTHDRNFCHGDLRLKSIMLTVLHAKQLLRCVDVDMNDS